MCNDEKDVAKESDDSLDQRSVVFLTFKEPDLQLLLLSTPPSPPPPPFSCSFL